MKKLIVIVFLLLSHSFVFSQNSENIIFLGKINNLREQLKLNQLKYNEGLLLVGQEWGKFILKELNSLDDSGIEVKHIMNPEFLHIKFDNRYKRYISKNKLKSTFVMGENIILSTEVGSSSKLKEEYYINDDFKVWVKSPSHYKNMVLSGYNYMAYTNVYDSKNKRLLTILIMSE